jgi:hypothetical protein
MTLHCHKVDDRTRVDEDKHVHVPAGWQIAAGDADDIRVCSAHPWQSSGLVFANGHYYGTAANSSGFIGTHTRSQKFQFSLTPENRGKNNSERQRSRAAFARGESKI